MGPKCTLTHHNTTKRANLFMKDNNSATNNLSTSSSQEHSTRLRTRSHTDNTYTCQKYGQYGHQPVVLREPEPTYVDPSRLRANKNKRPPPPPKRSESTQLSNSNVI